MSARSLLLIAYLLIQSLTYATNPDDKPASADEWGFTPAAGAKLEVTPPSFVWRYQKNAITYDVQCARDAKFTQLVYTADKLTLAAHRPAVVIKPGTYHWRFRFRDKAGKVSDWSRSWKFSIAEGAKPVPLPDRKTLLARIPRTHPRLLVRPEEMAGYRERAKTDLKPQYDALIARAERSLKKAPSTKEPEKYPKGMKRGSPPWKKLWWGNRGKVISPLDTAAILGFAHLLSGEKKYADKGREMLMDCAAWDPKGASGYRYNDEAGMPYAYYFSRAYTYLYDVLTEAERKKCREVMRIRGKEMYDHLNPRHLWKPYSSHSNRAWHFLGEIGIAFHGEIPEADDWVWFAANVYSNVYPVWSDVDGGWHEGMSYWNAYISRFTWWTDVMRVALGINAFKEKPYFTQVGYYPMYLTPPGTKGGGFGDLNARWSSSRNTAIMQVFATQANNPHWQWYVDAHPKAGKGYTVPYYMRFIRGAMPKVQARPPTDLPTSRCFRGTGQAYLNTNIMDAKENVQVIFKSSPFGTQSHGYESNNAFLLYAFGERLFIRSGRRDNYGSEHHKKWMWHTKSVNCITVDGQGQKGHSKTAVGEIAEFKTTKDFDYVVGEAAKAYGGKLKRFTRRILFAKPDIAIIYDTLEAPKPSNFEYRLHTVNPMTINTQADVRVQSVAAACQASILWPQNLKVSQTDKFDPPPWKTVKLVEYHLTAETKSKSTQIQFVTVLRPHRAETKLIGQPKLTQSNGGFSVVIPSPNGELKVDLKGDGVTAKRSDGRSFSSAK